MTPLDAVLQQVDHDLDNSLHRLFEWLKIPSISTDPAYSAHCVTAAQWLKQEMTGLGL